MTPQQYYDHAQALMKQPYSLRAFTFIVLGIVYVVCVETIAFVLRRGWRDIPQSELISPERPASPFVERLR
jgi:hypothetical protein